MGNNGNQPEGAARKPLLQVKNLKKYFKVADKGQLHAIDGISFDLMPNETLGLVGESGCGKSTVGNVLTALLPPTEGEILFEGKNMENIGKSKEMRRAIQMIFQDPYSSLNPRKTVRYILAEPMRIHGIARGADLEKKVEELAQTVGLDAHILDKFPHELDGGKRQLVGIARALALNPSFIVCDEPVSALDVSVQATIINLLIDMQKKMGLSYLFISHDLSVVRHISNRVAVMYLGQIIEMAETDEIFVNPIHPYTKALLSAVPQVNVDKQERIVLKGDVPSPVNPAPGCRFASRCWMACDRCRREDPVLKETGKGHYAACHRWMEKQQKGENHVHWDC